MDIKKEDVELAFGAIFLILSLLGPSIAASNDLTQEEKEALNSRLDAISSLVEGSKYPV
jgi:hypothetical protein